MDKQEQDHGVNGLIDVSTPILLLSTLPLLGLAFCSYYMRLNLESPLVVGILRAFVQLTVLGAILRPIFIWGIDHWWLVLLYCIFMVTLASLESSSGSAYYFKGMFGCILAAFLINIGLVSIFAFCFIIRPTPIWNPQYVIPIVGMLLGNCINAVALSMNAILTGLVEQSHEVELYLSFGATPEEASSRILREAVRVGAMPMLKSMAVIGLISIPGMMTGQILAGSPAMVAARYQMLIVYLIAMCAFGTILVEVLAVKQIAFDSTHMMLRTDRFIKREARPSFLDRVTLCFTAVKSWLLPSSRNPFSSSLMSVESQRLSDYVAPKGALELETIKDGNTTTIPRLEIKALSRSFDNEDGEEIRTLFTDVSHLVYAGDIVAVRGPSGVGKSQLLRLIAGLSPMDGGDLLLENTSRNHFASPAQWRRQVRYVSQYKVDIPGTPKQFVRLVTSFHSWWGQDMPSYSDLMSKCRELIRKWGLESSIMDSDWKLLSGGEAQRVYVAIAIASQPKVLLLDESTSALDLDSKVRVEKSVEVAAHDLGISVLWITHDQDQVERIGRP